MSGKGFVDVLVIFTKFHRTPDEHTTVFVEQASPVKNEVCTVLLDTLYINTNILTI